MLSVHLSKLAFYAYHGFYEEERKLGNNYEVDITISYDERTHTLDDLNNLVNYESVYEIVKKRMSIPTPLLEEIAESMISKIRHQYRQVSEISVSIFKLQPPIENFQGKAGITLHRTFEH
jgi:dihydroneopterin aldolase